VKKVLFAAALVATLTLTAAAEKAKPPASVHRSGNPDATIKMAPQGGAVPALCNPCLFYGGDINPNDPNAVGYSDENTTQVSGSSTYGAVAIPAGHTATIGGILFNIQASAAFDPSTASYDIETGVTEGVGGTSVASGNGQVFVQQTGQNVFGFNEYSIVVKVNPKFVAAGGQTYWFNVTPNCTNVATDGSCQVGRFFASNTTDGANNLHGSLQPLHEIFFNSPFFGFTWANWCDAALGLNGTQCGALSFGLLGTGQ